MTSKLTETDHEQIAWSWRVRYQELRCGNAGTLQYISVTSSGIILYIQMLLHSAPGRFIDEEWYEGIFTLCWIAFIIFVIISYASIMNRREEEYRLKELLQKSQLEGFSAWLSQSSGYQLSRR